MKTYISLIFIFFGIISQIFAQENSEQMLIFRNSGEINLLYTSEIDSIICSIIKIEDSEEEAASQVFYTKDSVIVIPISDIDSVAFGSRNVIEPKENVKMMMTEDSLWITRYEGEHIFYKGNTPDNILPKEGDKLFYGKCDNLFPVGLTAKVTSVQKNTDSYLVTVENVELSQIFHQLFYAGEIKNTSKTLALKSNARALDLHIDEKFQAALNFSEKNGIVFDEHFTITGKIIASPLTDFYHMEATLRNDLGANLSISSDDSGIAELNKQFADIPLGNYALFFNPSISLGVFAHLKGEMSINLGTSQISGLNINFTRNKGAIETLSATPFSEEDRGLKSQIDLTLDGQIMAGLFGRLNLTIVKCTTPAALDLRIGPSLNGEFGIGVLSQLYTHKPELFSKAKISFGLNASISGKFYTFKNLVWGESTEHVLFSYEHLFWKREYDLFPNYTESKAVEIPESDKISAATQTDNEILHNIETGFELYKESEKEEILDSVFVGIVESGYKKNQGFKTDFVMNKEINETPNIKMRPLFHYAGYSVRAKSVSILNDILFQPTIFGFSNGASSITSGVPYQGQAMKDNTLFIAGSFLPIVASDTIFSNFQPIITFPFIDERRLNNLYGKWEGEEEGIQVRYIFNEDNKGEFYNGAEVSKFSFDVNQPQIGRINLLFDERRNKVLYIESITESKIQYRIHPNSTRFTLSKILK